MASTKELGAKFQASYDYLRDERSTWDAKERLLIGKLDDQITKSRKSQVTDGHLATIQWERAARVMAQLPTGKIQAITQKDVGKNTLMNIAFNRYIMPNANAQYPRLIKNRLIDVYSRAWGAVPVLWDYRVDDEYIGPDSWIINIRDFFPEPGRLTINDCDWVMVSTTVNLGWLKSRRGKDGWDSKNIDKIVREAEEGHTPTKKTDSDRAGANISSKDQDDANKGDFVEIELMNYYERGKEGRWIAFAPDFENAIVRDIPNPHENGKIPVGLKQNFPRLDHIIGLSDIERGETLQRAKDSLINLYLDGVKMSIFPPLKISPNGVKVSSIRNAPAARWIMNDLNSVQNHQVSPQGINSFVSTYQFLHGAMNSQAGTTDTRVSAENAPNDQGKTPAAIQANQARENARDNWDRFQMEQYLQEEGEYFINLLANKQEKPIPIDLFEEEIRALERNGMDDVADIYESGQAGTLTLKPSGIRGKYRFYIDQGSTMAKDEVEELKSLTEMFTLMAQMPPEMLRETEWSADEHLKRIFIRSGIQDWERILQERTDDMDLATAEETNTFGTTFGASDTPPVTQATLPQNMQQPQSAVDPSLAIAQAQQADAQVQELIRQQLGGV